MTTTSAERPESPPAQARAQPLENRRHRLGVRAAEACNEHWHALAVFGAFVLSACFVPTLTSVAISDDWVYIRSVETLVREGRLELLPIASSHLVFQVAWGALFAFVFGPSLGVIRLSVVVLWLLSGLAFYGLCWELTRKPALSALGTAAYLFNPLGYVLAFSFMTDAPFTAMMVISLYGFTRGLRDRVERTGWVLAGSAAAAAAVLVRQPGVLIPLSVVTALLATRRLDISVRSMLLLVKVAGPPALAYVLFFLWLRYVNGVPVVQDIMRRELLEGGWTALRVHAQQLGFIQAMYVGLFALPIAAAAAPALPAAVRAMSARGWILFLAYEMFVIASLVSFWRLGLRMPYVPHFLNGAGLGPNDLVYSRAGITTPPMYDVATVVCGLSAVVLGLVFVRALVQRRGRPDASIVLAALFWNAAGAVLVSVHFRFWTMNGAIAPSLDRYFLPMLPLALAALIWALQHSRVSLASGWYLALVLGLFAVVGTRDNLAFHEAIWDLAQSANAAGISNLELDAGASWDGYYLGEYSLETRGYEPEPGRPWWLSDFTPIIDPRYVVTAHALPGHTTRLERPYFLWLEGRRATLLLQQRDE